MPTVFHATLLFPVGKAIYRVDGWYGLYCGWVSRAISAVISDAITGWISRLLWRKASTVSENKKALDYNVVSIGVEIGASFAAAAITHPFRGNG